MAKLSVNINKIATLRNARGGNIPNVLKAAQLIEQFGAEGITVHPRPDERHIRYADVAELKPIVTTEFNVEGYPTEDFLELVLTHLPHQVTLVPDAPDAITSNAGWDSKSNHAFLVSVIERLKKAGIRTSLFVDPVIDRVKAAADTGTDRVELYTEAYAHGYSANRELAIAPYRLAAQKAVDLGLGVNGGHDLSLENLRYFGQEIPGLLEVSIGHALISDALYFGMENTVRMYSRELKNL